MSALDRILGRETRTPQVVEYRAPAAANMLTRYVSPGSPMVPDWDAENALKWGYYANVFVMACCRAIASDLSRLPFRVGDPESLSYDIGHPMARHLGPPPQGPNPVTSARKLFAWSIIQYLVTGRVGWEIETESASSLYPVAYWPLVASQLKAIPSEGGASYWQGFEYGNGAHRKMLRPEKVFYTWEPAQDDWRQPESRLQAARLDISVAVMQDRYDWAFLKNDARPPAIVVHERFAQVDERDAWRNQFRSNHQGPENAGRIAFSEVDSDESGSVMGAIDIKTLGLTQKDAEFIRRYDQKLRAITVALGVPLSRLGDASARTFSNASEEMTAYWQNTLLPISLDFADALNIQLLPRYGGRADVAGWLDTSNVAALQTARNVAQVKPDELVAAGIASRNEGRLMVGLARYDDPDFDVIEAAAPPPAPPPPVVMAPPALEVLPGGAAAGPKADSRGAYGPAAGAVRRTNLYKAAEAQVVSLEKAWERAFRKLFARQVKATVSRLEGKRGRQAFERDGHSGSAGDIFDQGFWTASTTDMLDGLYSDVFAVGGARITDKFGIAFDLEAPWAAHYLNSRPNQLAGQVTETTYRAIQGTLTAGIGQGEAIPELAARIRGVFSDASDTRATRIARTEVIGAYNYAGHSVAAGLPGDVVGGQEWIATSDARTRPAHRGADGQIVAIGETFSVDGEAMEFPGDPSASAANVVNCRCTIAFLTPDEMPGRGGYDSTDLGQGDDLQGDDVAAGTQATRPAGNTRAPSSWLGDTVKQKAKQGIGLGPETAAAGTKVGKAIASTTKALDDLLVLPEAMERRTFPSLGGKVPVRVASAGSGANGSFYRMRTGSLAIHVKPTAANPGFTFAHEFGHFLDFSDLRLEHLGTSALSDPYAFTWATEGGTAADEMKALKSAFSSSPQYQRFLDVAKGGEMAADGRNWAITQADGTEKLFGRPSKKQVYGYWLSDQEVFARGFAQWTAVRSGDKSLLASLRAHQASGLPDQWSDADFEPILRAFDALFAKLGVLK